jgi:hypothetical protein
MNKFISITIFIFLFTSSIKVYTLDFPPELLWWINEIKK